MLYIIIPLLNVFLMHLFDKYDDVIEKETIVSIIKIIDNSLVILWSE